MARKIRRSDLPTVRSVQGDDTTRRRGLEALLEERRGALEPRRATCTASADPTDAAQELEKRVWLAILDRSRDLQAKMDEALARLAAGRYGLCAVCEELIPVARLRAMPFAVRCLPCQERPERRTRTMTAAVPRAGAVAETRPGADQRRGHEQVPVARGGVRRLLPGL